MALIDFFQERNRFLKEATDELMELITPLISMRGTRYRNTNFSTGGLPSISVRDYIYRIVNYTPCSFEVFLIATLYIKRLLERTDESFVSNWTIHRIIITSVLVASKYHEDIHYDNCFYSRVGGISTKEMFQCELELLTRLSFDLWINPEDIL